MKFCCYTSNDEEVDSSGIERFENRILRDNFSQVENDMPTIDDQVEDEIAREDLRAHVTAPSSPIAERGANQIICVFDECIPFNAKIAKEILRPRRNLRCPVKHFQTGTFQVNDTDRPGNFCLEEIITPGNLLCGQAALSRDLFSQVRQGPQTVVGWVIPEDIDVETISNGIHFNSQIININLGEKNEMKIVALAIFRNGILTDRLIDDGSEITVHTVTNKLEIDNVIQNIEFVVEYFTEIVAVTDYNEDELDRDGEFGTWNSESIR